jgi:hypothetical protein
MWSVFLPSKRLPTSAPLEQDSNNKRVCSCKKFCGGNPRSVDVSTYNRHFRQKSLSIAFKAYLKQAVSHEVILHMTLF